MTMARTRKRTKTARQMTKMKIGLDSRPPMGVIVSKIKTFFRRPS